MDRYRISFPALIADLLPSFRRKPIIIAWLMAAAKHLRNLQAEFVNWGQRRKDELKWNGQTIVLEHYLRVTYADDRIRIVNLEADTNGAYVGPDDDVVWHIGRDRENESFVGLYYSLGEDNFQVIVPVDLAYDPDEMRRRIDRYKLYGTQYSIIEQ
jgi:hypothetical protein